MGLSPSMKSRRPARGSDAFRKVLWHGLLLCLVGCEDPPRLTKAAPAESPREFEVPDLGPVSEEHVLGALVDQAPVYAAASQDAPILGYLHAGAQVPRTQKAYPNEHCTQGWYRIAPRGYVCTEKAATTDPDHPTLAAMALQPTLQAELPYVYARTTKVTALFSRANDKEQKGVELSGRLNKSTVMAIVGSWTAPDESLEPQRLGLRMDGKFVRADDLEAAEGSSFSGMTLEAAQQLPVAFVVRRGVRAWKVDGLAPSKDRQLEYHEKIPLTGRFRTIRGLRFWATGKGFWVRHKDVTVVRRRHKLPDFATEGQKWLDISVITGTLVAYQGKNPVYTTLVSVGRDRLGDPETTASTARGTFRVVEKHITRRVAQSSDEALHDAPWAMKLESGQWLAANPRHNRFGIEHTDGDIDLAPQDGAFLFRWSTPPIPEGWHGIVVEPAAETVIVNIRK